MVSIPSPSTFFCREGTNVPCGRRAQRQPVRAVGERISARNKGAVATACRKSRRSRPPPAAGVCAEFGGCNDRSDSGGSCRRLHGEKAPRGARGQCRRSRRRSRKGRRPFWGCSRGTRPSSQVGTVGVSSTLGAGEPAGVRPCPLWAHTGAMAWGPSTMALTVSGRLDDAARGRS